jgi:hypothetical protein
MFQVMKSYNNILSNLLLRILQKEKIATKIATSFPGSFFGEGKTLVGAGHVAHRKLIA